MIWFNLLHMLGNAMGYFSIIFSILPVDNETMPTDAHSQRSDLNYAAASPKNTYWHLPVRTLTGTYR